MDWLRLTRLVGAAIVRPRAKISEGTRQGAREQSVKFTELGVKRSRLCDALPLSEKTSGEAEARSGFETQWPVPDTGFAILSRPSTKGFGGKVTKG